MSIETGIPLGYAPNSRVPANTAVQMPNAQVISNNNIPMVDLAGNTIPNAYGSPGNLIKILEIFEDKLLVLIPLGNGSTPGEEWVIGYFDLSVLPNQLRIRKNIVTWNNSSDKTIFNSDGSILCSIPATRVVQFLYETIDNNYACILFNDNLGNLVTGYVSINDGTFLRYPEEGPALPNNPTINNTQNNSNDTLPPGINMNLQTGFATLDGCIDIINTFNNINNNQKVPSYFELSNGIDGCTILNKNGEAENNNNLNTFNSIINANPNLSIGYYHHLTAPNYIQGSMSCEDQGKVFAKALINSLIPNTSYVFGLKIDEKSFGNITSVNMNEIEQCATEFMNGLEATISGNYKVMLYTSLNMINNVSTPPLYESNLTQSLLWMDSYLLNINNSTYEPTNTQITNAFYEMNSIKWGNQTGWSIWGYENSNNITSCIVNIDAIYIPNMSYLPVNSDGISNNNSDNSDTSDGNIDVSLLEKAAIMIALDEGFKDCEYHFGVGPSANSAGYGTDIEYFSPSDFPLSPSYAWTVLLRVLKHKYIPYCDQAIDKYFPQGLSDCRRCAIYTFGYNLEGWVDALVQKLSQNDSWEYTYANFLKPLSLEPRRRRSWNTFVNNKYDLFMSNLSMLPNQRLMDIAEAMNGNS